MTWLIAPLHVVYSQSGLVAGPAEVAIRPELPVEDGDMILCDDLTGAPIAVDNQAVFESNDHWGEQSSHLTKVFSSCVVLHSILPHDGKAI